MAIPIIMPRQGQSVESCILTEWYKEAGDKVSTGDLLFAYETDKAAFEEEAHEDGILLATFYEAGDEVPVLANVAVIGQEGDAVEEFRPVAGGMPGVPAESADQTEDDRQVPGAATGMDEQGGTEPGTTAPSGGRTPISPRARRLACDKRISTENITGTGPGGRIIERDILEEIRKGKRLTPLARKKMEGEGLSVPEGGQKPYGKITSRDLVEMPPSKGNSTQTDAASPAGPYTDESLSNVRKIIASAMHRSLQNSAQLTHHLGANVTGMLQLRKEVKAQDEGGIYIQHYPE